MMAVIKVPVITLALQLLADAAIWESSGCAIVGDVKGLDEKCLGLGGQAMGWF